MILSLQFSYLVKDSGNWRLQLWLRRDGSGDCKVSWAARGSFHPSRPEEILSVRQKILVELKSNVVQILAPLGRLSSLIPIQKVRRVLAS
jgi:hypothetical protein